MSNFSTSQGDSDNKMYETLITDVKAHIDSKTVQNNEVLIRGWTFNANQGVCPVRFKYSGTVKSIDMETRPDITDKFKRNNIILCGWKVVVPVNKYIDVQIKYSGEWNTFLSFNTFNIEDKSVSTTESSVSTSIDVTNINDILPEEQTVSSNTRKMVIEEINEETDNKLSSNLYIFDNFFDNPNEMRTLVISALKTDNYKYDDITNDIKVKVEGLLGVTISNFESAVFNSSIGGDKIIFGTEDWDYKGIIFLTPSAPVNTGITLYKSHYTQKMYVNDTELEFVFKNGNMDSTGFEQVDVIGNVYNRFALFNSKMIHATTNNFGKDIESGRLAIMFKLNI